MKNTLVLILLILLNCHYSYSQTNTFPGNVGIGTANPLSGGSAASWLTLNGTTNYSGGSIYAVNGIIKGFSFVDNDGLLTQQANSGQKFVVNNATTAVTITPSGEVGIGTATPPNGYKLAVNGKVIAESMTIKLQGSWPDYVFHQNYSLIPLADVKTYIDQNHHLPEIPPAKDLEKNGLNLGEMNMLLTKKIEEMTLYLITIDKMLKDQQKEIDQLKQQGTNKK